MRILGFLAGLMAFTIGFCSYLQHQPQAWSLQAAAQPQAAPAAPYVEEEVTFANGDVTLAGTLTLPSSTGTYPAVVMITGSGPQNRDEEVFGFKVFWAIADHLARNGVAVLRYDDRGVGGSTGVLTDATTEDLAGDALAGLAWLAARPEIRKDRIGLIGHSEGATAAAIAAAKSADVAFAVMLAGTGVRGDEVLRQQARDGARAMGASEAQVSRILDAHRKAVDAAVAEADAGVQTEAAGDLIRAQIEALPPAQRAAVGDVDAFIKTRVSGVVTSMSTPWMRHLLTFDPATALAAVTCPVFAVYGGKDTQVPPSLNRAPVEAALAHNDRVKVVVYPQANHLFQQAITGFVGEYQSLARSFVPGFLEDLTSWIRGVTGR